MRLRTPLAVAVVGALLVVGATTGSTLATWRDQAVMPAASVRSGVMSHTVLNAGSSGLGSVSVQAGGSSAVAVTGRVSDTSTDGSKNLRQEIRVASAQLAGATNGLTLSHLLLSVTTRTTGGACPTALPGTAVGYTSAVLGQTAPAVPDQGYDVCVALAAATGAPASTGGVLALSFQGRQVRPTGATAGWTTTTSATVNITVTSSAPAAPTGLACVSQTKGETTTITWTPVDGVTYSLVSDGQVRLANLTAAMLPVTITSDQAGGKNVDLRVRATNASGASTDSASKLSIQFNAPNCSVTS